MEKHEKELPAVGFWEGREPGPEYYAPIDPYAEQPKCNIDLAALAKYARSVQKQIIDLTYDEVAQFFISADEL